MSEPFLAEIRIVGFNFAPQGWAFCDGQILPINQNQSLYSLLGTTYGGDGRTSFALPDLRSRTPIHKSSGHNLGEKGGSETVTLNTAEMAAHKHDFKVSSTQFNSRQPTNAVLASGGGSIFRAPDISNDGALGTETVINSGGGQAHDNMQPYTTLGFCIALQGLFPSRN